MTRTSARQLPDPKRCVPLLLLLLAACEPREVDVRIPVEAFWEQQPVSCLSEPVSLQDLRLYLSDFRAVMRDGTHRPVKPLADENWQSDRVAMLDLEDGQGGCDGGTPETSRELRLKLPAGDIQALSFDIGVPFDLNHADPLAAERPLDDPAMHWHWRSGYKFLRAGIVTPDDGFWLHLGSSGCEGTTRNITGCKAPNRVTVSLTGFVNGETGLALHLDELFDGIALDDGTPTDCASGPFEESCAPVFENLGLSNSSNSMSEWVRMQAL